jgi:hypothetical protein
LDELASIGTFLLNCEEIFSRISIRVHARLRPRTACWREIESRLGEFLEQLTEERLTDFQITEQANQKLGPLFTAEGCRKFLASSER